MKREYSGYPIIGVGAVVLDNNSILLVKRANDPCRGHWSIPGGIVNYGEPLIDAVTRELFEETGLKAEPKGIIWIDDIIIRDQRDLVKYHYVIIDFLMKPMNNVLRPGSDAIDVKWFSLEKADKVRLTPSTSKLIKYLRTNIDNIKILPFNYKYISNMI